MNVPLYWLQELQVPFVIPEMVMVHDWRSVDLVRQAQHVVPGKQLQQFAPDAPLAPEYGSTPNGSRENIDTLV